MAGSVNFISTKTLNCLSRLVQSSSLRSRSTINFKSIFIVLINLMSTVSIAKKLFFVYLFRLDHIFLLLSLFKLLQQPQIVLVAFVLRGCLFIEYFLLSLQLSLQTTWRQRWLCGVCNLSRHHFPLAIWTHTSIVALYGIGTFSL